MFCLMFFAAGAPTPLYGVYQAQLRFSATMLTAIFAIYALVLPLPGRYRGGRTGVGFGLALLGVNRTLIALAAHAQHAGLIAAIFIVSFLGPSIPVMIAGVATARFGLHRTALAYCVAIAALVAVAADSLMLRWGGPATGQGTS